MNLSSLSVKRPVTTVMFILIVLLLGVVSLTKIPIDLYPNIEVPVAIVQTTYSNVSPEEVENLVTRPIEEVLGTVSNIDTIQSITSEGSSVVVVMFNFGTDMNFATLDMREKIDMIKGYLPEDATEPTVLQLDINATAVIQAALSGADEATLYEYADEVIRPALERIEGVASVSIDGGYQNYVSVQVDTAKLTNYGLTIDQLAGTLAAENINLPAGSVNKGDKELLLRTVGEFESLEDIRKTPILLPTGGVVLLQDVADVYLTNQEQTSISKVNGQPAVSISVQKQSGTNTVMIANEINNALEELQANTQYDLKVVVDQSDFIKGAISQVGSSAIIGGLLAIIVLFIFLRSFRSTIIIGLSMPISIIATGILIYFNGITLNMMTLGGITLGIGMLVDNSVVVLENIYRFVQEGHDRVEASILGAKEVAMAVTASTLTTVAVFLPMVFVEGITSIMFREFSLTVTFSLVSSLVVALTLIPMLASKLLVVDEFEGKHHENKFRLIGWLLDSTDKAYKGLDNVYRRTLKWSLSHRKSVLVIAAVTFLTSIGSVYFIGSEFMPVSDEGAFSISVELEDGAKINDTQAAMDQVVERILDIPEVDYIFSSTAGSNFISSSANSGTVTVQLVSMDQRDRSVFEVIVDAEELLADLPGVQSTLQAASQSGMMTGGSDISISIAGDDLDVLESIANDIVAVTESVQGTRNVASSLAVASPQVEIYLNRNNASRFGLTTATVSSQVQAMLNGRTATRYKVDGDELNVVIEGDERFKESINNLNQLEIQTPTGVSVPLELVADVVIETGAVTINREDLVRTVTVSSGIYDRDLSDVVADIEAGIDELDIPTGYDVTIGGANQEMIEAFSDLALALILAVALVYMIIAAQFESLLQPFIIMFSIPLAFGGGLLALFISYRTLNITSIIGFIMLSGIVVNNAIVLLDYIGTRRRDMGEERNEAIINAGPIRLRPILMTSLTTILGLLPLSLGIGEGAELQASMGTVVIGGLLMSSLLTLIVIPVVYSIFDDLHDRWKNRKQPA